MDINNVCVTAAFMREGMGCSDDRISNMIQAYEAGYLELVSELCVFAELSENLLAAIPDANYPGIYDYEVSTDFGKLFADFVLLHEETPSREDGKAMLIDLISAFFAQGGELTPSELGRPEEVK